MSCEFPNVGVVILRRAGPLLLVVATTMMAERARSDVGVAFLMFATKGALLKKGADDR